MGREDVSEEYRSGGSTALCEVCGDSMARDPQGVPFCRSGCPPYQETLRTLWCRWLVWLLLLLIDLGLAWSLRDVPQVHR
jgi:hypothetical protein